jgi:cytochrome c
MTRVQRWTIACAGAAVLALGVAASGLGVWALASQRNHAVAAALTGGDPARGPALIRRYGCGGCHTISALTGADGKVAGPLDGLRQRVYIGGVLPNEPSNLVRWIVSPRDFSPRTAMPATGITETEARDVAAFLYAH